MAENAQAIFDSKEADLMLQRLKEKAKKIPNADKVLQSLLSNIVFQDIDEHFDRQEGPNGGWKKWSNIYQEHMDKIGRGGNKILQFTGILRQSIRPGPAKSGQYTWVNPAQTKDGFPYARAHDEGGKQLPQREFMWLSDKGMDRAADTMMKYLLDE